MSGISDTFKKIQLKLSSQHPKDKSKEKSELPPAEKKVFGFNLGEDLTQPVKPIPGSKNAEAEKMVKDDKASKPIKGARRDWIIHDISNMSLPSFTAIIVLGLIGVVLVYYVFSVKMKDKYPIQIKTPIPEKPAEKDTPKGPEKPKEKPKQVKAPALKKNSYVLSPHVTLSLDGIVSADGKNIALIDDQIVEVGDIIKGAQVLSITPNEVVVSFQGKDVTMTLK